jgi:hypothetical protein
MSRELQRILTGAIAAALLFAAVGCREPSQTDLRNRFQAKRQAFEALRRMVDEDGPHLAESDSTSVTIRPDDNLPPSLLPARWNEYRRLLNH